MTAAAGSDVDVEDALDAIVGAMVDEAVTVACPDRGTASDLTAGLYGRYSATLHVEHYPVTDDDSGHVEYIALLVRKLHYDRDLGWMTSDVREEPDVDLR